MPAKRELLLQEFFAALLPFQRLMKAERERFLQARGLTHGQVELMHLLLESERCSIKDIASALGVTGSAATQFVHQLAGQDCLSLETDPEDRRSQLASLSTKGRDYAQQVRQQYLDYMAAGMAEASDEEIRTLIGFYTRMSNLIRAKHKQ